MDFGTAENELTFLNEIRCAHEVILSAGSDRDIHPMHYLSLSDFFFFFLLYHRKENQ